jgi:hypothetical protein
MTRAWQSGAVAQRADLDLPMAANAGLQLIMAKERWHHPLTAMRYVKLGAVALAEITELLDTAPRRS